MARTDNDMMIRVKLRKYLLDHCYDNDMEFNIKDRLYTKLMKESHGDSAAIEKGVSAYAKQR